MQPTCLPFWGFFSLAVLRISSEVKYIIIVIISPSGYYYSCKCYYCLHRYTQAQFQTTTNWWRTRKDSLACRDCQITQQKRRYRFRNVYFLWLLFFSWGETEVYKAHVMQRVFMLAIIIIINSKKEKEKTTMEGTEDHGFIIGCSGSS